MLGPEEPAYAASPLLLGLNQELPRERTSLEQMAGTTPIMAEISFYWCFLFWVLAARCSSGVLPWQALAISNGRALSWIDRISGSAATAQHFNTQQPVPRRSVGVAGGGNPSGAPGPALWRQFALFLSRAQLQRPPRFKLPAAAGLQSAIPLQPQHSTSHSAIVIPTKATRAVHLCG